MHGSCCPQRGPATAPPRRLRAQSAARTRSSHAGVPGRCARGAKQRFEWSTLPPVLPQTAAPHSRPGRTSVTGPRRAPCAVRRGTRGEGAAQGRAAPWRSIQRAAGACARAVRQWFVRRSLHVASRRGRCATGNTSPAPPLHTPSAPHTAPPAHNSTHQVRPPAAAGAAVRGGLWATRSTAQTAASLAITACLCTARRPHRALRFRARPACAHVVRPLAQHELPPAHTLCSWE